MSNNAPGIQGFQVVVSYVGKGEVLVIPAHRPVFRVMSDLVTLVGSFMALRAVMGMGFEAIDWGRILFLGVAFSILVYTAIRLLWTTFGKEELRVQDGSLERSYCLLGLRRTNLYLGAHVRDLTAVAATAGWYRAPGTLNFTYRRIPGSVQFAYLLKKVKIGRGLSLEEGEKVVGWLKQQLSKA